MSEAFIGQIVMFGGTFAPKNWAFCNGQILSIQQNTALFAILGTTYGGNGQTTFALPDLRGRVPVNSGGNSQGPGVSIYALGQQSGTENVTLLSSQMPTHSHQVNADNSTGSTQSPSGGNLAQTADITGRDPVFTNTYTTGGPASPVTLNPTTIQLAGGNQAHTNIQPVLAVNFIICLYGIFPSRN